MPAIKMRVGYLVDLGGAMGSLCTSFSKAVLLLVGILSKCILHQSISGTV